MEQLSLFNDKIEFKDVEFMTAKEKEKVYKTFKKVIDARDINLMDKLMYEHMHLHCGFIAHYDIHVFKQTYSGAGFEDFLNHFVKYPFYYNSDYRDINELLLVYVKDRYKDAKDYIYQYNRINAVNTIKALAAAYSIKLQVIE